MTLSYKRLSDLVWLPTFYIIGISGCIYFLSDIFTWHGATFHWLIMTLSKEWHTQGSRPAWGMYVSPAIVLILLVTGLTLWIIIKKNSWRMIRITMIVTLSVIILVIFILVRDIVLSLPATVFALSGIMGSAIESPHRPE